MAENTDPRTWRRGMTLAEFWESTGGGRPDTIIATMPPPPVHINDVQVTAPCVHPFNQIERTVKAQRVRRDQSRLVIRVTVTYVCSCGAELERDINQYRVPDGR